MKRKNIPCIAVLLLAGLTSSCKWQNQKSGELLSDVERTANKIENAQKAIDYLVNDKELSDDRNNSSSNRENFQVESDGVSNSLSSTKYANYLPARLTDRPEQILCRYAYTVSYNQELKIPNWVAWHLTKAHTNGPYKRKGIAFTADEEVEGTVVTTYDYARSGYDRGHMCPSGDNKWSKRAQEECFLMSNMCPQVHGLNSGDWNEIEGQCRAWAKKYGDVYIVSGPILIGKNHKRIGKAKVTVPEAFFKVVLCLVGRPKAIGFVYRNIEGNRPKKSYVNSVDQIERITKIDFFASLPDKLENQIEQEANLEDW